MRGGDLVKQLEVLESNTAVIKIDTRQGSEGRNWLESYARQHREALKIIDKNSMAIGSFNDFLQAKFKDDPKYKGKIIVAEISGQLGLDDEYFGIDLEWADLSGSRLVNVDISSSLKHVALRDCYLEKVTFARCHLNNIDLRGSKIKNCIFFGYQEADKKMLQSIHLGFADPGFVQDLGLFNIQDSSMIAVKQNVADRQLEVDKKKEIDAFIKDKKKKQGWGNYFVEKVVKTGFSKEMQKEIQAIEDKYKKKKEEQYLAIEKEGFIRIPVPSLDPTYRPNQKDHTTALKVNIKATREDLVEYLATDKAQSFNDFIAKKYNAQVVQAKQSNQGQEIIVIADLSKQDLSNLDASNADLSKVIMAKCNILNSKFVRANLTGSCFEGSVFNHATDFEEADLTDANLIGVRGQQVNFKSAMLVRAQMQYSNLPQVILTKAVLYSADCTGSNLEGSMMQHADARKSDFEKANLRYIDARYVDMRKAFLRESVMDNAKLVRAQLDNAVLDHISAANADLTAASMNEVSAIMASFKKALMNEVKARKGNFTEADFEYVKAQNAFFEMAAMASINAKFSNFEHAVLTDVKAQGANFYKATLDHVKAERIDVSNAIMKHASAIEADMNNATMVKVNAYKADFTRAILNEIEAQHAELRAACFKEAQLIKANIKNANLIAANLEKANVKDIIFNEETLLLNANLRDAIGAKALKELQEAQHKMHDQWFGRSRYGYCAKNLDGSNDRFKCQRIGAAVLSAAIGGGSGYILAGPLGGVSGAAAVGFVSDASLTRMKNAYFKDLGYINNAIGDRLAEIGAIAQSTGVYAVDKAIDGAAAGLICSSAGLMSSIATGVAGIGISAVGLKALQSGYQNQSMFKKIVGGALTTIGAVSTALGFGSLAASSSYVGYGALYGGIAGGAYGGYNAAQQLYNFDEDKKTGLRPEEIYKFNVEKAKGIIRKIVPTMQKFIVGLLVAVVFAGAAYLAGSAALAFLGISKLASVLLATNVLTTTGVAGFVTGYLYDDKIVDTSTNCAKWVFSKATFGTFDEKVRDTTKPKEVEQEKIGIKRSQSLRVKNKTNAKSKNKRDFEAFTILERGEIIAPTQSNVSFEPGYQPKLTTNKSGFEHNKDDRSVGA